MTIEMTDHLIGEESSSNEKVIRGIIDRIQERDVVLKTESDLQNLESKIYPISGMDSKTQEEKVIIVTPNITSNNLNINQETISDKLRQIGTKIVKKASDLNEISKDTAEKLLRDPFKIVISRPDENLIIPVTGSLEKMSLFGKTVNTLAIAGLALSGCKALPTNSIDISETTPPKTQTFTPTQETIVQEPTSVPTPSRPEGGAGGAYSAEQIQRIRDGEFVKQEEVYKSWLNYWSSAENRPFHPETKDLHYLYLFDKLDSSKSFVLLQALGEYGGKLFSIPIAKSYGVFMTTPPKVPEGEFSIPEGFGPLEVSGGKYSLGYEGGDLVRVDINGEVMERLDMTKGVWAPERFKVLLPDSLEEVKRSNVLHMETIKEDLQILLAKEKQSEINYDDIQSYKILIPQTDIEAENKPSQITLLIEKGPKEENPIRSCSLLEVNGHQLLVYGILMRRPGSEIVDILHFAKDITIINQYREEKNRAPYDFNEEYMKMFSGNFKSVIINMIIWRGYAEKGGMWDTLISLQPKEFIPQGNNDIYFDYIGKLTDNGFRSSQADQQTMSFLQNYILPAASLLYTD